VLESKHVIEFWNNKEDQRKSIPKSYIEEHGQEVPDGYHPRIDFLKAVDSLFLSPVNKQTV
jgi:recombination protein U